MAEEKGSISRPKKSVFIKLDPDDPKFAALLQIEKDLKMIDEELGMG